MARIEYIKQRLEQWGKWLQQTESGALGYPSSSAFARMAPSGGRNESVVPMISIEASETDDAVKSLQLTQSHLHMVLTLTYAKNLPRYRVAHMMGRAESTISANLDAADRALERWFDDKHEVILAKARLAGRVAAPASLVADRK